VGAGVSTGDRRYGRAWDVTGWSDRWKMT